MEVEPWKWGVKIFPPTFGCFIGQKRKTKICNSRGGNEI
jgi:hypothetical protein